MLLKALYDFKEAPQIWQKTLRTYMFKQGFAPSPADPCLYKRKDVIIAVFVDDMLIADHIAEDIEEVIAILGKKFKIKDLNEPKHFLGIVIRRDWERDIFSLSQGAYLRSLLKRFNKEDVKVKAVPIDPAIKFRKFDGKALSKHIAIYVSSIGGFNWAALAVRVNFNFAIIK